MGCGPYVGAAIIIIIYSGLWDVGLTWVSPSPIKTKVDLFSFFSSTTTYTCPPIPVYTLTYDLYPYDFGHMGN